MTEATLASIAGLPIEVCPVLVDVPGQYTGTVVPLNGLVTVLFSRNVIDAVLVNDGTWMFKALSHPETPSVVPMGGLFRTGSPGTLIERSSEGQITSDSTDWEASRAISTGETMQFEIGRQKPSTYRFRVIDFSFFGPARGAEVGATRFVFSGGSWALDGEFCQRPLLVRAHTPVAARIEDELFAATIEGEIDDLEGEALWLALSFVSGNQLQPLIEETYDENGQLISARHRRGKAVTGTRDAPFSKFLAVTGDGFSSIANGVVRLQRQGFPIEVVIEHLHTATSGNIDIDAQHLILAIHCAFEAWNRKFGLEYWIDDDCWEWFVKKARRPLLSPIYDTVGPDVKANLASAFRHANRTTTGWRETQFFAALQIDVSSAEDQRALEARDEILHNGYFLRRWHELTETERQNRRDDVERLRRLGLLIVFRLVHYDGNFIEPIHLSVEGVVAVDLPDTLMPPPAS